LRHMLDCAREAKMMAAGRTRQDLDTDRQFNLAMTRLMEIVGEAAGGVSEATRNRHCEIPWSQIIALRNRLIHGYDEVDFDILWEVLQKDLPALIERLEQIVDDSGAR